MPIKDRINADRRKIKKLIKNIYSKQKFSFYRIELFKSYLEYRRLKKIKFNDQFERDIFKQNFILLEKNVNLNQEMANCILNDDST